MICGSVCFGMDAWTSCHSMVHLSEDIATKFEDDFMPKSVEKLPDHEKYLATLGKYKSISIGNN